MEDFSSVNGPAMPFIQRFSAHQWMEDDDGGVTNIARNSMQKARIQEEWEGKYPFIKTSAKNQKYGDAACTLSHLLLWKEKLIDDARLDYIFVFEEDVRIVDPFLHNRTI